MSSLWEWNKYFGSYYAASTRKHTHTRVNNPRHQLHVSMLASSSLRLPDTVKQLSFAFSLISPGDRDQRQAEGVWSTWGRGEEKESNMSDFGKCSQNTPQASERKDGGWNWFSPDRVVCCLHTQTSPWETAWPSMARSLAPMTEIGKKEPLNERWNVCMLITWRERRVNDHFFYSVIVVLGVFGSHRTTFTTPSSCFQWWRHMWDKSGVFVSRLLPFFSQWPRNVILPAAVALEKRGQNSQKSNLGGWDDLQRFQQKNFLLFS